MGVASCYLFGCVSGTVVQSAFVQFMEVAEGKGEEEDGGAQRVSDVD